MNGVVGLHWLAQYSGITPVHPFSVLSKIGTARRTESTRLARLETYPPSFRPEPTVRGHMLFAFKHETLHLEFLARFSARSTVHGWRTGVAPSRLAATPGARDSCSNG